MLELGGAKVLIKIRKMGLPLFIYHTTIISECVYLKNMQNITVIFPKYNKQEVIICKGKPKQTMVYFNGFIFPNEFQFRISTSYICTHFFTGSSPNFIRVLIAVGAV